MNRSPAADEAGFTLIEMLVAMLTGVVVIFALLAILVGTLRLTQRTFTRVDATRQGRTAISDIENELHSACIGGGQIPIQPTSTANSLQFLSYYGAAATSAPTYHTITYDPAAQTLVDASFAVTGSAPNFVKGQQTSQTQLLTNASPLVLKGVAQPVFQYFAYQAGSADSSSGGTFWLVADGSTPDPVTGTVPLAAPLADAAPAGLTPSDATNTVEVLINLSVGATSESLNNQALTTVNNQVDDAISLRLTTPPNEYLGTVTAPTVPPGYGPCQ